MTERFHCRAHRVAVRRAGLLATAFAAGLIYCPVGYAETATPAEDVPATAEAASIPDDGPAPSGEAAPEEPESIDESLLPSIHVTGSVWRSKPGIVFLQTPIGLLSLSSKTALRDVKSSHKITLSVNGSSTAVDIRDRGTGSLVHRYLSGAPRFASEDKKNLLLWTPEGDQPFVVGAHGPKIPRNSDRPITVEVNEAGAIKGVHDLQFDVQVSQAPKIDSQTRVRLRGTVSKLKSAFVFMKTPLGVVTVSAKTGVRNAKVGQDMTVWIHGDHVAIDLYQENSTAPLRRFLSGRLVYATPDKSSVLLWTPEGEKAFSADHRGKGSLASLKEGAPITVELDQQGEVVDIRRLN